MTGFMTQKDSNVLTAQLQAESKAASTKHRPIHQIAQDICHSWTNVNYAAKPYLQAMHSLSSIEGNYFEDSGRSIVSYFLANANTFRGEDARRLKAELKALL